MNDMAVQQIVEIEYTLLKHINRVRVAGVMIEIEFIPGKNWVPLKFTSGTGLFSEKAKQSDSGISYSREIKCNVVTDDKENLSLIDKLEHSYIVIRVKYNSGEWKVIGIPGIPVKMESDLDVDKSGRYKIVFSCDSIYRACFLKV